MLSIPVATQSGIAAVPCTCAATFRPRRWARSTSASRSSRGNWQRSGSVPGVMPPPVAITLTKSMPRVDLCFQEVEHGGTSAASPFMYQQCPRTDVTGRPLATMLGPGVAPEAISSRSRCATSSLAPQSRAV